MSVSDERNYRSLSSEHLMNSSQVDCGKRFFKSVDFSERVGILFYMRENVALKLNR